jgi:hypothetical protein
LFRSILGHQPKKIEQQNLSFYIRSKEGKADGRLRLGGGRGKRWAIHLVFFSKVGNQGCFYVVAIMVVIMY